MQPTEEYIQTFADLGLTLVQSRVLLAIFRLGRGTVKTMSEVSKLARQEIYRAVEELQELGLIEKILTSPTEYRTIPIDESVSILLQRRLAKTEEIKDKAHRLLQGLKSECQAIPLQEEPQFAFLPTGEAFVAKTRKSIDTAQRSIDGTWTWSGLLSYFDEYNNALEKAASRDVEIRIISDKPEGTNTWPKPLKALMKTPLFKIRTISTPASALFWIKDRKEIATLTVPPSVIKAGSLWLWSTCPSVIASMQDYFEMIWRKAEDPRKRT